MGEGGEGLTDWSAEDVLFWLPSSVSSAPFLVGGKTPFFPQKLTYSDDSAPADTQHALEDAVEPSMLSPRPKRHQILLVVDPRHFPLVELPAVLFHVPQHATVVSRGGLLKTFDCVSLEKELRCTCISDGPGPG